LRHIERALSASERLGSPGYVAWALTHCGWMRILVGDWEQARSDLERAVALHRRLGISSRSASAIGALGALHRMEGAWEEATQELEEAIAIAGRGNDRQVLAFSHGHLAEIEISTGRPAAALARLRSLALQAGAVEQRGLEGQRATLILPRLAWSHLELGEVARAGTAIMQAARYVRTGSNPFDLVQVLWVQALVASRQGQWEEAAELLEEGLSLTRSMPCPYIEARTLQVYGDLHRHRSEPQQARVKLEAALALFRGLGAREDIERTEQVLAALG
jgi:tetratricopeptide (TPR) repeat protein